MAETKPAPKTQAKTTTKAETKPAPKKRLSYAGIKLIGHSWYSSKDGYKKPFKTADECAEHFDSEA